jgi:flagellar protein FlaG
VASETFVSAMMLITGVVAASILIVAVLPIVWTMVGTFSSASATTDTRMRTDFKIVATYGYGASGGGTVKVWMKNIGSTRIGIDEVNKSDVLINYNRTSYQRLPFPPTTILKWNNFLSDDNSNYYWDPGETLEVDATAKELTTGAGKAVNFQFVLPSSVARAADFTTSV